MICFMLGQREYQNSFHFVNTYFYCFFKHRIRLKMIKTPNFKCIGVCAYAILITFSILFFVERVGFMDLSFHLFCIIKDGDFAIQNNRFVAFFTQLFPLLSSKAGFGLTVVMKLYSASFIILNFTCFIILAFVLKSWRYGVIMVLLNVLMDTHTFFWAQSELQ